MGIVDTANVALGNSPFFNNSLWFLYGAAAVLLAGIIITFVIRNQSQKKFLKRLDDDNDQPDQALGENQYFYQSPLYMVDDQPIKIHGKENMKYTLYFNNTFEKWLSILGLFPIYGIQLKSDDYKVQLKPTKPLLPRFRYNVYVNDEQAGYFESKKMIKEKGAKKLLSYRFEKGEKEYHFNNEYLSFDAVIQDAESETDILTANRSFFDLAKEQGTNRRGEKHNIDIIEHSGKDTHELWLALYAQVMVNKNN